MAARVLSAALSVILLVAGGGCNRDTALPEPTPQAHGVLSPPPSRLGGLKERLDEILASVEGRYGVYFRVLDAAEEIAIQADRPFYAASCYKVPLVLYLYEKALTGELNLEEEMVYTRDFYTGGAGILKDKEPGSAYSLRQLASMAIIDSDNIAARMLMSRLGRDNVGQYHRGLGAAAVDLDANLASPRDVALALEHLLTLVGERPDHFGEILAWMEVSYPRDRIPRGLPEGVRVANKTGTWYGVFNDAALIFLEGTVSVLVVMSEEVPTYGDGIATIASITRTIYAALTADDGTR